MNTVHLSPVGIPQFNVKTEALNSEKRQLYLNDSTDLPVSDLMIQDLVQQITSGDGDNTIKQLFEFCYQNFKLSKEAGKNSVLDVLQYQKATDLGKARLLTTLARAAKMPARVVMGILLEEKSEVTPHYWVEIYQKDEWLAYDPSEGYNNGVPYNYLALRKNAENIISQPLTVLVKHADLETVQRDVTVNLLTSMEKKFSDILDLTRLSMSTRLTLGFLLLLPLGALLTVFIRQVVGPDVYGTFTPTFLAIAFTQVGWKAGLILLVLVTIIGVIGRTFTAKLGLNRVSRLTLVLTLVSISMVFSVSLMVHYGLVTDGNVVLLPIVILTSMIDKIYRLADSDGAKVAMTRLFWTFVVAAIVANILQMETLGLWLVEFPEAHLMTAAFVILMSQYHGTRVMRRMGLSWMLEPIKKKEAKSDFSDL